MKMHLPAILLSLTLATTAASKCGDYDGCPLTETCTTVTRTTAIETCMPTPTCAGVYCKIIRFSFLTESKC